MTSSFLSIIDPQFSLSLFLYLNCENSISLRIKIIARKAYIFHYYIKPYMRANVINFLVEAATASSLLFIPIYAIELGAENFEVGVIGALYGLALFISSYIFGRLADIHGRKKFLLFGLLASAISFPLQALSRDPFQLLLARVLVGFSLGAFPAALIAYIYDANKKIGKFTAFGSLGWAVGNFIAGAIATYWKIFLLGSFFLILAFLLALRIEIPVTSISVPFFPVKIIKNSFWIYLSFLLRHSGAHMIWIIFPLYLASLGISKLWIGIIYFTNSFFQFLIMPKLDTFKGTNLVISGLLFSAITFFSFTLASNQFEFLLTQILLAFSWSCLYVGSLKLILDQNIERATATGLLKSTICLASILGPLSGGILSQYYGYLSCIYGAIALTIAGFLIAAFLNPEVL
ncbi:MAG: MFS transporter [Methanocellales archaeon]